MLEWMTRLMGRHEDQGPVRLWLSSLFLRHVPGQLTCGEFEEFVQAYHDDELSAQQRRIFDRHMHMCPMCEVSFQSYLRAVEMGRKVCASEDAAAPDDLPEELVRAILEARAAR